MLEHRSGGEIRNVPAKHADKYARWRRLLNTYDANAEAATCQAINLYVDNWLRDNGAKAGAAFSSSWIPGSNWEGTVYQPIHEAILESFDANPEAQSLAFDESRFFFGLIVIDVMSHRDQGNWICWHEPHPHDIEPLGMFYRPKQERHEAA